VTLISDHGGTAATKEVLRFPRASSRGGVFEPAAGLRPVLDRPMLCVPPPEQKLVGSAGMQTVDEL
jgi:hypothetical protein